MAATRTRPHTRPSAAGSRPARSPRTATRATSRTAKAGAGAAAPVPVKAKTTKPAPRAKPVKAAKPAKPPKAAQSAKPATQADAPAHDKLVRDSFTMPRADFDLIDALKARALGFQRPTKKSELLRAGLHALQALDGPTLQRALHALTPIKTGRPKKAR